VRWDNLRLDVVPQDTRLTTPLFEQGAVVRTFDTPEFQGMTFYEVRARSIINKVPESSYVPFRWTINPYRGCSHACAYCFARKSHTYLDLDYGKDFDSRIVVKVNAPELLRRELSHSKWEGEHIAMGTNVDTYQRAEGRYRLMRGILEALRDFANPFSILTKGTLILRDLDLLVECAEVTDVATNVSVGSVDQELWKAVEPGTPSPLRRLDACRTLNEAGVPCGVLMAPVLPFISDSDEALEETVRAIASAGATHISPIVLHLRKGGSREWFLRWLDDRHPDLVPRYRELYGDRAYAPKSYQSEIGEKVARHARRFRVGEKSGRQARRIERHAPLTEQLRLV
jgi:DNA repair photolyase